MAQERAKQSALAREGERSVADTQWTHSDEVIFESFESP